MRSSFLYFSTCIHVSYKIVFSGFLFSIPFFIVYEYDILNSFTYPFSFTIGINHRCSLMFVCFILSFAWVICPNRENFIHLDWNFIITGEELKILTCTLQAWPLSIWGFFNVLHLLWHWASVYNSDLRGPVTHTPVAEYFAASGTHSHLYLF